MTSTRMRRSAAKAAPLLIAAAVVLSACAAGGGGSSKRDLEMAPVVTTHEEVTEPLTLAMDARTATLDPLLVTSTHDVRLLKLIGGTLFELSPDSSASVTPSLASDGELSEDGMQYTATLKDGATFTDGTPLTADDVVATFERARTYEANAYLAQIAPVSAVEAVDDATVRFSFTRPYPSFETFLAYPNMAILKASEIGADLAIPAVPTFAGAFAVEGDYFSNKFSLERYTDFVGSTPAVKTINVVIVTDANSRIQQVRTGQVDFAVDPLPSQFSSLKGDALPQITESVGFYYLNMNNKGDITADPNVRKAISKAVDRAQLTSVITGGYAEPMSGFFPASFGPGNAGVVKKDVSAAKELLVGTACAEGCELSLLVSQEWAQQAGVVVQQNLAEIGITVSIESAEPQVEIERLFAADFDLNFGLFGDYSTVPEGLPGYCMQYSAGYLSCLSSYESADAEAAVNDFTLALDETEKTSAMDQVTDIFLTDQPYATISGLTAAAAVSKAATGVLSMGSTNLIHVATLAE